MIRGLKKWQTGKTVKLAREILGTVIARRFKDGVIRRFIAVETEAYDGFDDKASHAARGKTLRNKVMFERGGIWYVYLIYGNHWMLNLVTGPKDYPAAILIRGLIEVRQGKFGKEIWGPGRLTKELEVNKEVNGLPARRNSGLWIEESKKNFLKGREILSLSRVGVDYAGEEWASKSWRFKVKLKD